MTGAKRKAGFLSSGWWLIYFAGIAAVYALGQMLWSRGVIPCRISD